MTRLILVRHGETEWNRIERFRGRADIPLNPLGLAQAEATGKRIAAEWLPEAIYSSPLSRAFKTAEAIAGKLSLPVISHQGLIDIDYGQWQGLTPEEAKKRWPELVTAWYRSPHKVEIPGGESLRSLRRRSLAVLEEIGTRHRGQTIVLVGHTVLNRVLLLAILGLGNKRFWNIGQDTCALNVIRIDGEDYILVCLNDTCHLKPDNEVVRTLLSTV